MENEPVNLEVLIEGYSQNIRTLEREIRALQKDAGELNSEVTRYKDEREKREFNLSRLRRNQASLWSQLDELKIEFGDAQLDGDVGEEQRIRRRKQELDKELSNVEDGIRNSRIVEKPDHDRRAGELAATKESLEKRLPRKTYETALNNPLLQSVADTLREDADRLRKLFNSISLPAASKDAVEEARRRRGVEATSSPAYLVQQEKKRQQRMKRFEGVAGNTDAVHDAMKVSYREPEPRTTVTSGANDGVLSGSEVERILREKQTA